MTHHLKSFLKDESGAVTVDWVVLTAAIMVLATAVTAAVVGPTQELGEAITASVESNIPE